MTSSPSAGGQRLRKDITESSPLRAYADIVIGTRAFRALLRHETVAVYGSLLPGALGLVVRKRFWPALFLRCGPGVVWGRGIVVRHAAKMRIGEGVVMDDGCFLDARGCAAGDFRVEDGVLVSRDCILSGKHGYVRIGARANLGARCLLYSAGGIDIGADTMLAANCYVGGGRYDHRTRTDVPMSNQPVPGRGVSIGDDCWLGAGVVVTDGVSIGTGCVIGAGAVVTADVPEYSIAAGVPARVVGRRQDTESGSTTQDIQP